MVIAFDKHKRISLFSLFFVFLFFYANATFAAVTESNVNISPNPAAINTSVNIAISAFADGSTDLGHISLYVNGQWRNRYNCNPNNERRIIQQCDANFSYVPESAGSYTIIGDIEDDFQRKIGQTSLYNLTVTETGGAPTPSTGAQAPRLNQLNPNSVAPGENFSILGEHLCNKETMWGAPPTIYLTQSETSISVSGEMVGQTCTEVRVALSSSLQLAKDSNVDVRISNWAGETSNSLPLFLKSPPTTPATGGTSGNKNTGTDLEGKLELSWPKSPLGTELTNNTDVASLVKYLYEWGISLGGFAAFIILVIAGFQYMGSAGNPTKMGEAIRRIRDAVIGLVLLLGSVLILNTINPQLTQLKVPTFPTDLGPWSINLDIKSKLTATSTPCVKANLFTDTGVSEISGEIKNFNVKINSVEFVGKCQLTLYRLSDFQTNSDNPPIVISGDVSNMAAYGETRFRSAKLIDFNIK